MEAKTFVAESNRQAAFRSLLMRHARVVETQLVQALICSHTHTAEQRLSRRLMVMSDCLEAQEFEVTQDQLSPILDRHRNRISEALVGLKGAKLVEIGRGELRILDRECLEKAACDCYRIVKQLWTTHAER